MATPSLPPAHAIDPVLPDTPPQDRSSLVPKIVPCLHPTLKMLEARWTMYALEREDMLMRFDEGGTCFTMAHLSGRRIVLAVQGAIVGAVTPTGQGHMYVVFNPEENKALYDMMAAMDMDLLIAQRQVHHIPVSMWRWCTRAKSIPILVPASQVPRNGILAGRRVCFNLTYMGTRAYVTNGELNWITPEIMVSDFVMPPKRRYRACSTKWTDVSEYAY